MKNYFVIVAHVPTASVTEGFIPELRQREQPLIVVTDQPERHQALVDEGILDASEILPADVFNPVAVLNILNQHFIEPAAVFTNSDHLQTSAAIVADYYQLPAKTGTPVTVPKISWQCGGPYRPPGSIRSGSSRYRIRKTLPIQPSPSLYR
ncbi:hypothetical protein [Aliamphritea spongicola]|nr:hypothetical protein [Aliamphritea spongicola]